MFFFFFNDTATTEIYTLSLHDALPISRRYGSRPASRRAGRGTLAPARQDRDCERATCLRLVPRVAARAAVAVARGGGGGSPPPAGGPPRAPRTTPFRCPPTGFARRRGHREKTYPPDAP